MWFGSRRHPDPERERAAGGKGWPLVAEYVLDLSMASLDNADVTSLYERLVVDPRLGGPERHELTEAFLILRDVPRMGAT